MYNLLIQMIPSVIKLIGCNSYKCSINSMMRTVNFTCAILVKSYEARHSPSKNTLLRADWQLELSNRSLCSRIGYGFKMCFLYLTRQVS